MANYYNSESQWHDHTSSAAESKLVNLGNLKLAAEFLDQMTKFLEARQASPMLPSSCAESCSADLLCHAMSP